MTESVLYGLTSCANQVILFAAVFDDLVVEYGRSIQVNLHDLNGFLDYRRRTLFSVASHAPHLGVFPYELESLVFDVRVAEDSTQSLTLAQNGLLQLAKCIVILTALGAMNVFFEAVALLVSSGDHLCHFHFLLYLHGCNFFGFVVDLGSRNRRVPPLHYYILAVDNLVKFHANHFSISWRHLRSVHLKVVVAEPKV